MKSTLPCFNIPEEVKDYLKKYDRFRAKRFFQSSIGKFYVGTEVRYMGCTKIKQGVNGWNPVLDRIIDGDIECVKFTKSESYGFEDIVFLPILLNVRFSEEGKNHLVGGKIGKDGTLYLYDSLAESMVETTLKKVNKMYHHVYGLFLFMGVEDGSYVFI